MDLNPIRVAKSEFGFEERNATHPVYIQNARGKLKASHEISGHIEANEELAPSPSSRRDQIREN